MFLSVLLANNAPKYYEHYNIMVHKGCIVIHLSPFGPMMLPDGLVILPISKYRIALIFCGSLISRIWNHSRNLFN